MPAVAQKDYLEAVRESLGLFGIGYRGLGDETICLIVGQGHQRTVEIAETIRKAIQAHQCEHKGVKLPKVTVSMGIASSPPDARTQDLQTLADERKLKAKKGGKNRVVSS